MRAFLRKASERFVHGIVDNLVALALTGSAAVGVFLWVKLADPQTVTWNSGAAPADRPTIGAALGAEAIEQLGAPCHRAKLAKWFFHWAASEECIQIEFDPPALAEMLTERVPFNETGLPGELLNHFINVRHQGCLTLIRRDDIAFITMADPAAVVRTSDNRLLCPRKSKPQEIRR
jgi:hypothetical protein